MWKKEQNDGPYKLYLYIKKKTMRKTTVPNIRGVVVHVHYLQTTLEIKCVFRA